MTNKTKRVLIAEDDMRNAFLIMRELIEREYSISLVDNSADLMRLALGDSMKFDLIISDVIMPQGKGDDVVYTLRNLDIDIPVILISGIGGFKPPQGVTFFKKPYCMDELMSVIEKTLDG